MKNKSVDTAIIWKAELGWRLQLLKEVMQKAMPPCPGTTGSCKKSLVKNPFTLISDYSATWIFTFKMSQV